MNDTPVPMELWELPSSPKVVMRILERIPLSTDAIPELIEIIRGDPAISARILAAANARNPSEPAATLEQAARNLGESAILMLSLQFTLEGSSSETPTAMDMLSKANRELGRLAWVWSKEYQEKQKQAEETIQMREQTISHLEHQALRDPLTEIYNRRFFLESLRKEAARCCRRGAAIGLLFLDVDEFKALNDRYGHLVGDVVLKEVAHSLKGVLRRADVLARYGGEEFVVLPNDPNERGILQLADRLRTAVEELAIPVEEGEISVTISIGCTLTVPKQAEDDLPRHLLASADAAMYDAKQLGKNRVVFRSLLDDAERSLMQQTIDCSFSRWLVQRRVLGEEALESVMMDYVPERSALGELAVELGFLSAAQVAEILKEQAAGGDRFGTLALKREFVSPEQLAVLLARQRENPHQLAGLLVDKKLLEPPEAQILVDEYLAAANG